MFIQLQRHGWSWIAICCSEICQTEKDKYCMISLICGVQKLTQTRDYSKKETGLRYGEETGGYQ